MGCLKVPGPGVHFCLFSPMSSSSTTMILGQREAAAIRLAKTRESSNQWGWLLVLALTTTGPTRSNHTGGRLSLGKTISWSTSRARCQAQDTTTSSLPLQTSPSISSTTAKPDIVYTYSQSNPIWLPSALQLSSLRISSLSCSYAASNSYILIW